MSAPLVALLTAAQTTLARAGVEAPGREARLLLAHARGQADRGLPPAAVDAVDEATRVRFEAVVARRARREPFAYVVGEREFWSLPFSVGPDVLVPRPESETLVEAALALKPDACAPLRILDLGTGSGCLLLALLAERPQAWGVGIDRSGAAIARARANAQALGLSHRAAFVVGDWLEAVTGRFDIIVSNPPYIPDAEISHLEPEVARYEPRLALAGGSDGLHCYRRIFPALSKHWTASGVALFEMGADQAAAAVGLAASFNFSEIAVRPDLAGQARCLIVRGDTSKKDVGMSRRSG